MFPKSLGKLEEDAFSVLLIAIIVIMMWRATWGITDTIEDYLYTQYGVKKLYFNIGTIIIVVLIIGLNPEILKKL
jgi:succinate dehydrogenase hydrophobic anchor subunit